MNFVPTLADGPQPATLADDVATPVGTTGAGPLLLLMTFALFFYLLLLGQTSLWRKKN